MFRIKNKLGLASQYYIKKEFLLIFFLIVSLPALSMAAGVVSLHKTGQTTSYATGDDGDIQAGVDMPSPRFTDNGNQTMTDNLSGLMWTKNSDQRQGWPTWQEALDYVAGMNSGIYQNYAYTDWRLPNINELESLFPQVAGQNPGTWLMSFGFTNVSGWFWTSTTYSNNTNRAWWIFSNNGYGNDALKTNDYATIVWPVRSDSGGAFCNSGIPKTGQTASYASGDDAYMQAGVDWPSPRFTDNLDITITDNLTGLIWTKDANLPGALSWQEALDYVAGMNAGTNQNYGYTDWRLPNRNEMISLIDRSRYSPALPAGHPFVNLQFGLGYWSSSLNGKRVGIDFGVSGVWSSTGDFYVWPVRAGSGGALGNSTISASPVSHDFGGVEVGTNSTTQTFTVSNTGVTDLVICTTSLTGTDTNVFSIQNDGCSGQTIAPTGSCTLEAVFSPTTLSAKNANITIQSNDPVTPTLNISISGTGVDTIDPTGSITAPQNNLYVTTTIPPSFTATANDNETGVASVKFQYKTSSTGSYTDISTDTASPYQAVWGSIILSDNTYNLQIVVTDNAGNTFTTSTINYTVDATDPSGSITAPFDGSYGTTTIPPTFTATASDVTSNVASVKFQYKASNEVTYADINTDTSSPYQASWGPTILADGTTYNLQIVVIDNSGNTFTSSAIDYTVDTTDPTGSITSPSGAYGILTTPPTFEATASDATSGVVSVEFRYKASSDSNYSTINTDVTSPYQASWGLTILADGTTYNLQIAVTDNAGKTFTSSAVDYTVDATNPTGSITTPSDGTYGSATTPPVFEATALDATSGIATVRFQYKTSSETVYGVLNTDASSPYQAGWGQTTLVDGTTYNLQIVVADNAGNTFTPTAINYTVDTSAPTVSLGTTNNPTNSSPFNVTITFDDEVTGFALGDITVSNGIAGNFNSITPNKVWTVDITPGVEGTVTVDVNANVVQNLSGTDNVPAAQLVVVYDITVPTVGITSPAGDPTNISPIVMTVAFDETVTGFDSSDIVVGNGSVSSFLPILTIPPSMVWDVSVTPGSDGPVTVDISGGVAQDLAGNSNIAAAKFSINYASLQSYTTLSLLLSRDTINSGDPINAWGTLTEPAGNVNDLSGLDITITIKDENGVELRTPDYPTDYSPVTVQTNNPQGDYIFNGVNELTGFNAKGRYTVQASFAGASGQGLQQTTSQGPHVWVADAAGYAIIIEGMIEGGQGILSHNKTTNRIYNTLIKRLFVPNNIYYFNYDTSQAGVDELTSKAGIKAAIESESTSIWGLAARMDATPAPLYIIMHDHGGVLGGPDTFHVYSNDGDIPNDTIDSSELNTWITTLEGNLTNPLAKLEKRIVINGSCYSGSFIPTLSQAPKYAVNGITLTDAGRRL